MDVKTPGTHAVRWRQRVAATLVAAMAVVAIGPVFHMEDGHDAAHDAVFVLHDASQHHVTAERAARADAPADHCVACHWGRVVRGPSGWHTLSLPTLAAVLVTVAAEDRGPSSPAQAPLPARAPPSLA